MKMSFKEAAEALGLDAAKEGSFSDVCIDSRKVTPGCLFAAIKGEHFDGNDFVQSAVNDGAAGLLVSRNAGEMGVPVLQVEDTVQGLMTLAAAYRNHFDIPVAGVTGSVGKTTTKEMIACVLSERYGTLKTEGNFNNEIGLPLTLFRMEEGTQAAVIEMGMSNFGEISRLSRCTRPTLAVITKIGVSHMETLGSQAGILKAKMEIIDGLKPGAPLLVNGDDPFLQNVQAQGHPVYRFGVENEQCDFIAENVQTEAFCTRFTLRRKGEEALDVVLPAVGMHNVLNAAAAFGAGILLGVTPEEAVRGLSRYIPSGMRQRVVICDGITVIEDCYNASPDSMQASLSVLERFPHPGKRVAVLGDML
ncbi:MAG: UDP-N-acetylmuramoyl-tripeptide--D-alanyl-D-alanine ligase, partial [Clostridiales bacterium]|nr:UDP-N-acetylmuramoyl-tripeptide--D-alanyl-D-alanine ligase [Clostridiales bacterium]